MKASELMTRDPACCTPEDSVERAASRMGECDCGCLPVVEGSEAKRVVGVVTDRDIAVRAVARGKGPGTIVRDVMTPSPFSCRPDDDVASVGQTMAEKQVRRIVVVDDDGRCVGVISQADLARAAAERGRGVTAGTVAQIVERISEPSGS